MKIVIIGGTGLIGGKTAERLRKRGHEVIAASPRSGVDAFTGAGLAEALTGAQVVVDLSNSPSFEDEAVLRFFETSGRNLLGAGAAAGVKHHVALSVVGTDRVPQSGYFRAKLAQEKRIESSPIPYTIVRATQFFEFIGAIAHAGTAGNTVRVSPALFQPIAAEDVADVMADVTVGAPLGGALEIAGPDRIRIDAAVRRFLGATGSGTTVVEDADGLYFGARLDDASLVPAGPARLGAIRYEDWLRRTVAS